MPLTVLLPGKARQVGDWLVVDLPAHYESKERSKDEREKRTCNGEEQRKAVRDGPQTHLSQRSLSHTGVVYIH